MPGSIYIPIRSSFKISLFKPSISLLMFYLPDIFVSERVVLKSPILVMAFVSFSMWFCFFLLYQVHYVATYISQNSNWQAIEIDLGLFKQKKYLPELLRDLKHWAQGYQPRAAQGATEVT